MNIPIAAEIIGHVGSFPITNAYVNSSIVTVLFIVFALVLNQQLKKVPGKLQNGFEAILEFLLSYFLSCYLFSGLY